LIRYHAPWILPVSGPPIRDGWVAVDRGRIVATGRRVPPDGAEDVRLDDAVVMPGVVNAHTHLELSYLRDEVPPASAFVTWIRAVMAARRARPDPRAPEILAAIESGITEARSAGTAVVGDISNTLVTFDPLVRSHLAGIVFYELIRFNAPDPRGFVEAALAEINRLPATAEVRPSLAAHAPYSVGPLVLRALRETVERDAFTPCSIHLAESAEETEFIASGGGAWRALLEEVGAWDPAWVPPGVSPVQFLDDAGFLGSNVLAVHGVQMSLDDLGRLKARGTTIVTCPRSNGHTGAGAPPIQDFYDAGVRVAVGTDSLASTPDLNVFAEVATMRALAPSVPASALIESATLEGARALGFEADYGSIDPGKRAKLIAVQLSPDVGDVEEYLVGGVRPDQIRWLDDLSAHQEV
jgi:cytosine/adenosine deaminase-related metal-dependent hydrolase